jgi:hypothetical protein
MKSFFFAAILAAGSLALANQDHTRLSNIVNPQFSESHLTGKVSGTVEVNYAEKTVTMHAAGIHGADCKPGMICPQYLIIKNLNVTLPIVSIETNSCGILVVTAAKDERPVDGALQTLTVEDASHITCQTFVKYVEKATYMTSFFNRLDGKEEKVESTMDLAPVAPVTRVYTYAEGSLLEGFPKLEIPASGNLKISDKEVELFVNLTLNCKPDQLCPMYMPGPIGATLPIVEVTHTQCSTEIVARSANFFPYDHKGAKEIRIHDYTASVCEIAYPHLIEVEYYSDMSVNGGEPTSVHRAHFSFDISPVHMK